MAEIGYIALAIAFAVSVYSIVAFIFGARWGVRLLASSARKSVVIVSVLVCISAYRKCLTFSIVHPNVQP